MKKRQIKALNLLIKHAIDWNYAPYKDGSDMGEFMLEISEFWWHVVKIVGGMDPEALFNKWRNAGFPSIIKR